jgi:hypothetical protein
VVGTVLSVVRILVVGRITVYGTLLITVTGYLVDLVMVVLTITGTREVIVVPGAVETIVVYEV